MSSKLVNVTICVLQCIVIIAAFLICLGAVFSVLVGGGLLIQAYWDTIVLGWRTLIAIYPMLGMMAGGWLAFMHLVDFLGSWVPEPSGTVRFIGQIFTILFFVAIMGYPFLMMIASPWNCAVYKKQCKIRGQSYPPFWRFWQVPESFYENITKTGKWGIFLRWPTNDHS